jgi:hypothetical protein
MEGLKGDPPPPPKIGGIMGQGEGTKFFSLGRFFFKWGISKYQFLISN